MSDFDVLAGSVATLGDVTQNQVAQKAVLVCAVAALVRTHPDPAAFANAFRRAWTQLGQPNATEPDGSPGSDGMNEVLCVLESNCSAPLNIRPPGVACPPEH